MAKEAQLRSSEGALGGLDAELLPACRAEGYKAQQTQAGVEDRGHPGAGGGQASRAGRDRTIQVITKENTLETVALTGLDNSHDGRAKLTRIRPRAAAANNYYRRRLKNLSPLKNQAHPVFETWIVPSFSVDVETNSGA